jgi:hypothetical protein
MTPTPPRAADHGRRTKTHATNHRPRATRCGAALRLHSWTDNSTEEAMPDPDAGPSHQPRARILGGPLS